MRITPQAFENYLINKNLKERTIREYIYYLLKFNSTLEVFNQETVNRFLSDKSNQNSCARGFLKNFQKFLKINYRELGISEERKIEITEVELPTITGRKKERLVRPLSPEQIQLLEDTLETEELKLQLLLSYHCGLRLNELMGIYMNDFNWEEWLKDQKRMGKCRVFGKGDKEGIAYVPAFLMVRVYNHFLINTRRNLTERRLFTNSKDAKLKKGVGNAWETKLRKAGIKCGLTPVDHEGKPLKEEDIVRPHRLRHSYASYLSNVKKLDAISIQKLLRHSSIQSTQIYIHLDDEKLEKSLTEETPPEIPKETTKETEVKQSVV